MLGPDFQRFRCPTPCHALLRCFLTTVLAVSVGLLWSPHSAWAQDGKDVNAMLQQTFGIDAMGFSAYSGFWSTRMQADTSLMMKQAELLYRLGRYEEAIKSYRTANVQPDSTRGGARRKLRQASHASTSRRIA